jgi:hypothetical protein
MRVLIKSAFLHFRVLPRHEDDSVPNLGIDQAAASSRFRQSQSAAAVAAPQQRARRCTTLIATIQHIERKRPDPPSFLHLLLSSPSSLKSVNYTPAGSRNRSAPSLRVQEFGQLHHCGFKNSVIHNPNLMDNRTPSYPPYDHLFRCPLGGCQGQGPDAGNCSHLLQVRADAVRWAMEATRRAIQVTPRAMQAYQMQALAALAARQDPACVGAPSTGAPRAWAGITPRVPQDFQRIPAPAASPAPPRRLLSIENCKSTSLR